MVSAQDIFELNEINIFESEMTRAGEYLLKEVKSNATLSQLMEVVCEDNLMDGVKNVVCNIDMNNPLHEYALRNKEVSKIKVAHKQRRIQITYSIKNDLWYEFDLKDRRLLARTLYIPKNNAAIITGLNEEIGLSTFGGIYIKSGSEFYDYLISVIKAFQMDENEENKMLLEAFMSSIFDNRMLEVVYEENINTSNIFRQMLEENFVHVSNELVEKMWSKVDLKEFKDKILTKNYTLYSINNWVRSNESI